MKWWWVVVGVVVVVVVVVVAAVAWRWWWCWRRWRWRGGAVADAPVTLVLDLKVQGSESREPVVDRQMRRRSQRNLRCLAQRTATPPPYVRCVVSAVNKPATRSQLDAWRRGQGHAAEKGVAQVFG
jgi:hypothetical protein